MLEMRRRVGLLEDLALDPVELDLHAIGDAAMGQRLDQRLVGILEACIFADDGDRHLAFGIVDGAGDPLPARQVRRRGVVDAEGGQHLGVEPFAMIGDRHVVDRRNVARFDHRASRARCRTARACAAPPSGSSDRCGRAECRAVCRSSAAPRRNAVSAWSSVPRAEGMNGSSVRCV